jgi:hypothetical protein
MLGKLHSQLLVFDFPFSDLSRNIFPFRKPQVVLKIAKKITDSQIQIHNPLRAFLISGFPLVSDSGTRVKLQRF